MATASTAKPLERNYAASKLYKVPSIGQVRFYALTSDFSLFE
ncbi:hypothetical protein RIB2604_02501600 [Aspergillus luchuensis]|uniref:Uncharacterized protein n=1 Tax=Aspergillus kawachii TaxID=1069201 RepID=A0A146FQU8_ASPKA|nr:hypothetical protein RIB2604_02501600 [Aspergillus luchuensis]